MSLTLSVSGSEDVINALLKTRELSPERNEIVATLNGSRFCVWFGGKVSVCGDVADFPDTPTDLYDQAANLLCEALLKARRMFSAPLAETEQSTASSSEAHLTLCKGIEAL